jgi:hypothetical protein
MAPGHCGEPGASLTVERFAGSLDPSREGDGNPNVGVLLLASIKGGDTRLGTGRPVEQATRPRTTIGPHRPTTSGSAQGGGPTHAGRFTAPTTLAVQGPRTGSRPSAPRLLGERRTVGLIRLDTSWFVPRRRILEPSAGEAGLIALPDSHSTPTAGEPGRLKPRWRGWRVTPTAGPAWTGNPSSWRWPRSRRPSAWSPDWLRAGGRPCRDRAGC